MPSIYVSNKTELMSALSQATGGDEIVLASGNYGALDVKNTSFSSYVTLVSKDPGGAVFTSVNLSNTDYLRIDSVHVDNPSNGGSGSSVVSVTDSSHIQLLNSEINGLVDDNYAGHYGIYAKNISDATFSGNFIHDVKDGTFFNTAQNLTLVGNTVDHTGADSFKFTGIDGALIEGNMGSNTYHPESGAHLDFIQFQGTSDSSNVIIRGNVSMPSSHANVQGIYLGAVEYTNFLIEDNVIATGMIRGISINSGTNNVVRNNTLIDYAGEVHSGTKVMGADQSYGNIQMSYLGEAGLDGNLTLQNTDPDKPFYYGDYFVNPEAGREMTLEDLLPKSGTLAETMGATDTIKAFIEGRVQSTITEQQPVIQPQPTSEPEPTPVDGNVVLNISEPEPTLVDGNMVLNISGNHEIEGAADVIEIAHTSRFELDEATISLTFNADTVSGKQGIFSKDASQYAGGGNHIVSSIENGNLIVRFQDGSSDEVVRVNNIMANTDYDLEVSFGNGSVSVRLNGEQVHTSDFSMSWVNNQEYLQFGARGWSSETGKAGFSDVFDGTISDISIYQNNVVTNSVVTNIAQQSSSWADTNVVFEPLQEMSFDGSASSIINLDHKAELELKEGTFAFTFNADDLGGTQGLLSKDAYQYSAGGNHISAMLNKDKLVFRFQDEDQDEQFTVSKIKAGKDYDVQAWFGDGEVGLAVNGKSIGTRLFDIDLSLNQQNLQIGGLGWSSKEDSTLASNAFDGTISEFIILDESVPLTANDMFG